jgi:hypothetical protein
MKTRMIVAGSFLSLVMLLSASNVSVARHGRGHHWLGIFHGRHHGGHHKGMHDGRHYKRRGFASNHIYEITGADSLQRIKMKPLIDDAEKRIQSLRSTYRDQEASVMESLKTQLKPLLKEDQIKKLEDVSGYKRK